ncbi:Ser Thr kinase [Cryptosporidium sp. chipmunk genotype I]|uniref:Ser Thr kinase n=1 Tax=Cryptosporidium sp. chipmunk genotype I TaxID=1280935 RepID=UPI00351A29E7|nr:Ser Thr kinase [Cryptosporidium sp. chipmunk genotype I]
MMDWTSVIERDLRRLSELSKGDITGILGFLHHDACDGKLYRLVRSSFPFNLSSGPPNWGLCRPSEIPSTISLSLSYVYRNAVEAANAKLPIKWTEEHVELYLEATIVSCWSSLSENESENSDPDLGELEIGTDLLNEISLQSVGQKDSRIWGLWAVLDFLNHSRKQSETFSNGSLIYNAAKEAMKRIEQGRSYNSEPEALLTAVTTQFTSIMQKSKSGGSIKSPRDVNLEQIVTLTQNQNISHHHHNNSGNSSSGVEITSTIEDSSSSSTSAKPVESHRAAIRYVPSKRLGGRAHVFSLSSTTSSTMAATPAINKINDSTQYGGYSSSNIGNSQLNITGSNDNVYGSMNCDPKTPIPIRRQKFDELHVKLTENTNTMRDHMNIDGSNVHQQVNKHREYGRRIGFNIEESSKNVINSNTNNNINTNHANINGVNCSNVSNSAVRMDTESEVDITNDNDKNDFSQNPFVCKYSLEPAVKYPGYKLEVNGKYYEIISSIQKGGSSQVYKVKESKTGEMYALKCVRVFTKNHDHSNANKDQEEKSLEKDLCPPSGGRSRKSIRKSIVNNNGNGVYEEEEDEDEDDDNEEQQLLLMFTEEVNLLKKLRGCPHVIQLIDSEIALSCGAIDIIMELGVKDLNGILQGSTPLPSINALRSIWTEMVLALKNVHDLRIVHGDIKPANFVFVEKKEIGMANTRDSCLVNLDIENINSTNSGSSIPSELLGDNPSSSSSASSASTGTSIEKSKLHNKTVKIIDFGISRPIADDTTHIFRDKAVGSLPFMAPETVRPVTIPESKFAAAAVASKLRMPHQVMSRTADIWSLGAILYRITYKRHLFQQPIANTNKSSVSSTGGGKKSGSSGKSNIAPHEILMFLQNDQSKISFPREMGITFSEQTENESLWFDALRHLLKWALQWDPSNRPNVNQLLTHPFIDTCIVSKYVMQQIPKSISSKHPSISDDYLISNLKHNSQTDEDRAALLELLFKSTIPLSDLYKSKPKNVYLSSMRWNIVTNGNFLFYSLFEALKVNLNVDQSQSSQQQGSCDQSMINNLAISQYISLVKEISIPSPPSVNTLNTTSRKGDI